MSFERNQAASAYRRWDLPSFDEPAHDDGQVYVEDIEIVMPEPEPAPEPEPEEHQALGADFKLPTADDVERIFEDARKEGYAAGYEEGSARGRSEAAQLNTLVEQLDTSLTRLDQEVAEELLALAVELARQMVRRTLQAHPETVLDVVREALQNLPQTHALVHLHPEDAKLVREYLSEQLAHAGHRVIEDTTVDRGGVRLDASGSQVDATLQTRWRRIMDSLGRDMPWDGET
ncbi:MAG: flagellar assembly protein FliH [Zoogloea sp.]|nr:flagellar assembly protein FliH [Zoogloea sp.]